MGRRRNVAFYVDDEPLPRHPRPCRYGTSYITPSEQSWEGADFQALQRGDPGLSSRGGAGCRGLFLKVLKVYGESLVPHKLGNIVVGACPF
jgi:hypothetical protein